jgi:hypothetical protein
MKLRLWTASGEEKTSGVEPGPVGHAAVVAAVAETDWADPELSGVTLESAVGWADGSGSLDPSVGLSLMVEQYGVQHVGLHAPRQPEEIAQFLGAYLAGDLRQVFERLYDRAPTDAELAAFGEPAPRKRSGAMLMFGIVVILVGALFLYGMFR